jgi:hypothetical protein
VRHERRHEVWAAVVRTARSVTGRFTRRRGRPPEDAGVREPHRPKPTLPSAAVALAEPPVRLRRLFRLTGWFKLTGGSNAGHA